MSSSSEEPPFYCLSCRDHVIPVSLSLFASKNAKPMARGFCGSCGRTITTFVKKPAAAEGESKN